MTSMLFVDDSVPQSGRCEGQNKGAKFGKKCFAANFGESKKKNKKKVWKGR